MNPHKPVGIIPFLAVYATLALFLPLGQGRSSPQQDSPSEIDLTRIANYDIQVSLDATHKTLSGRETITWLNAYGPPTQEIKLHLYMNAFRSPDTRFFAGHGDWREDEAGWIDVSAVRLPGGADLTGRIEVDETVMTVPLPEPVETGARIRLEVEFFVHLPRIFSRTGYSKDYFFIAQWFPKAGVYSDGRWICPQYHTHTEYFADFGSYRVELTVPSNYIVGATGSLERSRTVGQQRVCVYSAYPVHDFAWAASPLFRRAPRDGTEITYTADGEEHTLTLDLLMQRDRLDQAPVYIESVRRAVTHFGRDYGPYPYDKLTVVDPGPGRGLRSGGMEYPMLITGGSSWLETYILSGGRAIERITIHEFGHQYWYGAVANNEFEEAWLDEGLTTYTADKVVDTFGTFGQDRFYTKVMIENLLRVHPFKLRGGYGFSDLSHILKLGLPESTVSYYRAEYIGQPQGDPITAEAYRPLNSKAYFVGAYNKPALAFRSLEALIGEQTVSRLFKTFFQRFRFRHPSGVDFRELVSEVAGEDMSWFFEQVWDGTGLLDYAVTGIEAEELPDGRFLSEVTVQRLGEVVLPQTVRISLEDGRHFDIAWERKRPQAEWIQSEEYSRAVDGVEYRLSEARGGKWLKIEVRSRLAVVSAQVDPEYSYPLDTDLANNSFRVEPDSRMASHAELSWVRVLGRLLHGFSVYN